MSLVYEALQKAEREKERKAGPVAPAKVIPSKPAAAQVEPKRASRNYLGVLVVGASLVALGAMVYVAIILTRDNPQTPPAPTPTLTTATPPPAPAAVVNPTPAPVQTTENDSRFKLTGIMITEGKFGAVINGHIVYDNSYVDGAIVKKVERDRVTLNFNGKDIVLRLS
jgi:hypothetical protein